MSLCNKFHAIMETKTSSGNMEEMWIGLIWLRVKFNGQTVVEEFLSGNFSVVNLATVSLFILNTILMTKKASKHIRTALTATLRYQSAHACKSACKRSRCPPSEMSQKSEELGCAIGPRIHGTRSLNRSFEYCNQRVRRMRNSKFLNLGISTFSIDMSTGNYYISKLCDRAVNDVIGYMLEMLGFDPE